MFSTNEWLQAISERSGGTTHKRIARGALSQIEIKLPNVTTQARVADILSDMDTDISVLGQKLAKARLIKQGMMLELLTGRIRLI
jgi:type I restriction enzyme S subunit